MKHSYIRIANVGEIDTTAMFLIGASTKRDDSSKIGFFGSGLKYALAVMLRNEIPFLIYSGNRKIDVESRPVEFRGKVFGQIFIDGKETSLTTEMGPDWEPWFAVREILCNAIDEGSHSIDIAEATKTKKGTTSIFIGATDKLQKVFNHWQYYFCEKRTDSILNGPDGRLFTGQHGFLCVYRKGILCHHEHTKSLFHYDMQWVEINESRIIKNQFDFKYHLVQWMARNADVATVATLYDNYRDTYEGKLDWDCSCSFNEAWLTVIGNRPLVPEEVSGYFSEDLESCLVLPGSLVNALSKTFGSKVKVKGKSDRYTNRTIVEKNPRQATMLSEVLDFLSRSEIKIAYPIEVCIFGTDSTLGQAAHGTIYVAAKVFDLGKRQLALTVLEEYSHLESLQADKTRGFQDFLLSRFLQSLEEKAGMYL